MSAVSPISFRDRLCVLIILQRDVRFPEDAAMNHADSSLRAIFFLTTGDRRKDNTSKAQHSDVPRRIASNLQRDFVDLNV